MKRNAVVIHDNDAVATALISLKSGQQATMSVGGCEKTVLLRSDIPFGHKFAICDIALHGEVLKYGESIGRSTKNILMGEHVHVHNVESERGRGDWN